MITYTLVALLVVGYIIWRFNSATKSRVKASAALDDYLGGEHPEHCKKLLYALYEDTLDPFMSLRVLFCSIKPRGRKERAARKAVHNELTELNKGLNDYPEERDLFVKMVMKVISINIVLAPITYFVMFMSLFLLFFCKEIFVVAIKGSAITIPAISDLIDRYARKLITDFDVDQGERKHCH